jgi:hypothetical protein
MRPAAGLDLNGLWDFAAVIDGEADDPQQRLLKDAGIDGAVIRLISDNSRLIAGRQATTAPHGRGQGWTAPLGDADRRLRIADCLKAIRNATADPLHQEALRAVVDQLAPDAGLAVFAVADVPDAEDADEDARDRLLSALRRASPARPTLLWRPIAAILAWLHADAASGTAPAVGERPRRGLRVAVVSMLRDGVEIGDAKLVTAEGDRRKTLVPERARGGIRLDPTMGAVSVARGYAAAAAPGLDPSLTAEKLLTETAAPWRHAVGQPVDGEIARLFTGAWQRIETPASPPIPVPASVPDDHPARRRLAQADVVVVEGPASGHAAWRTAILSVLGCDPAAVTLLRPDSVAQGCLEAALRIDRGEAAYYDFLPQLEINAEVRGEPAFVPLVPRRARLQGGTIYRGRAPEDYVLTAGTQNLTFYLIKESSLGDGSEERPRRARATLSEAADREHRIAIEVEQQPGQGRARIRIGSDSFAPLRTTPVDLDWSTMDMEERSRAKILESLRGLAYPDVAETPGHALLWHPDHPDGDLAGLLDRYAHRPLVHGDRVDPEIHADLKALRERLSRNAQPARLGARMGLSLTDADGRRPIGSEGTLPQAAAGSPMPLDAAERLERALAKAATDLDAVLGSPRLAGQGKLIGDIVATATWCFRRCPESITARLLDTYGARGTTADLGDAAPPRLTRGSLPSAINAILLVHAIGRTARRPEHIRRFLHLLDRRLHRKGSLTNGDYEALGRLLGGEATAADELSDRMAGNLVDAATEHIQAENALAARRTTKTRAYKRKFRAALWLIAVVLRRRRADRHFLDPAGSPAQRLLRQLEQAAGHLANATFQAMLGPRRAGKLAEVVDEIERYVHRRGRNAELLRVLIDLESGEEDEGAMADA